MDLHQGISMDMDSIREIILVNMATMEDQMRELDFPLLIKKDMVDMEGMEVMEVMVMEVTEIMEVMEVMLVTEIMEVMEVMLVTEIMEVMEAMEMLELMAKVIIEKKKYKLH